MNFYFDRPRLKRQRKFSNSKDEEDRKISLEKTIFSPIKSEEKNLSSLKTEENVSQEDYIHILLKETKTSIISAVPIGFTLPEEYFPLSSPVRNFFPNRMRGGKRDKIRFYDRISPIIFKQIADLRYGVLTTPNNIWRYPGNWSLPPYLTDFVEEGIEEGTVIWVESFRLRDFLETMHPRINEPYILVSGDSDNSVPGFYTAELVRRALRDRTKGKYKIIRWHTGNCDPIRGYEERFQCIPIGVSQWIFRDQSWYPLSVIDKLSEEGVGIIFENETFKYSRIPDNRKNLFLVNYGTDGSGLRGQVRKHFWNNFRNFSEFKRTTTGLEYYDTILNSKFVVSPFGLGKDCYRHHESLFFGSVPIMMRSGIDGIFNDLPIYFIDDYTRDITNVEQLEKKYTEIMKSGKSYKLEKLFMSYWQEKIYKDRPRNFRNCYFKYKKKEPITLN